MPVCPGSSRGRCHALGSLSILVAVFVFVWCARSDAAGSTPTRTVRSANGAFTIRIPADWVARDTSATSMHYFDEFFFVRNQRFAYGIHDSVRADGRRFFNPQVLRNEIPAGCLLITFATQDGPPGDWLWEYSPDTVGDNLARLLGPKAFRWESHEGIASTGVDFRKWQQDWGVRVWSREPTEPRLRKQAEQALRSVVFHPLPVTLGGQAVARAYAALPASVKALRPSVAPGATVGGSNSSGDLATTVEETARGMRVTFRVGDRAWSYDVDQKTGVVHPRRSRNGAR